MAQTLNTPFMKPSGHNFIPGTFLGLINETAQDRGLLGKMVAEKPTLFGPVSGATFHGDARAEVIGESEAKSANGNFRIDTWSAEPVKLHVGLRTSDEFKWANEDYQLGIMQDYVAPELGKAIARAVDLLAIHGINPKTGQPTAKMPKFLAQAANKVVVGGRPTTDLTNAVGLIMAQEGQPNGIATDAKYTFDLASEVYPAGHSLVGQPMYPQMGFSGATSWRGLHIETSTTVAGTPEIAAPSGIRGIIGDWNQIRWGFQRNFPLEMIEYGDPDNTGRDLKGNNEVFLRTEAVVYVAINKMERFALLKAA